MTVCALDACLAVTELPPDLNTRISVPHSTPQTARSIAELRAIVSGWRAAGNKVALVPTMGALHSGHIALVRRAATLANRTVVSIFVNPSQFAPNEDLARYPRDEAGDLAKLANEACHLVWAPSALDMYPEGFATRIVPGGAALGLESDHRPHFFAGVTTVCCKLFNAVVPDVALFGEKDYQQLCVVRQMVRDLNVPIEIVGEPTVRESDGLALSSRNAYLSAAERRVAPSLHRILTDVARQVSELRTHARAAPSRPRAAPLLPEPHAPAVEPEVPQISAICAAATRALEAEGFAKVDYVAVRDAETLKIVSEMSARPLRVMAAAWIGTTRLIDNVPA
jgi:pantoate--beta-alanine ligase